MNKNEKMISFVVPSYNSEDYLDVCVESLVKGGEDVEVIVVNDGSTDRTHEIAKSYETKYPDIVRVIDQENGGHGEAINSGLKVAEGLYFKVVDSDDWVDEHALSSVLNRLKRFEKEGGVDLLVTNYVYVNSKKNKRRTIRYQNAIPRNKIVEWSGTRPFMLWQNLTLHSCMFRTSVLRECGVELPQHIFYEDNYFIYKPLPYVAKLAYCDVNFYNYLIGRDGQSVAEEALKQRYSHQVMISKLCFEAYHLGEIKKMNYRLEKYMFHELCLMMTLGSIFPKLDGSEEGKQMVKQMWKDAFEFDFTYAFKIRFISYVALLNLPGAWGRKIGIGIYRLSNLAVPFN